MTTDQIYVNGAWRKAAGGDTIPVVCPSDGKEFARIARGGKPDIDAAVEAARRAFEGPWGKLTALERGRLLMKVGEKIAAHAEELAQLEARDTGKPLKQARADMVAAARYFEFYGAAADKVHGEIVPFLAGYTVLVKQEPWGVTGNIIPWNYPAQMFGRTLAPSLACGNATVLKPAEEACLTSLRIAQLAHEVGIPPGTINVVTGYGEEAGDALANHPDVDFVAFTGSPSVGTLVQKACAEHHRACVLELGGKSPQIVFEDARLAGSRVLVQRSIYDRFVGQLSERFARLRVGSHAMDLDCGPLISAVQRDRVAGFVKSAKAQGIPVLAEAQLAADLPAGGYYAAPVLFGPVPTQSELAREEVFGPVLSVIPFDDEADAIRIANDTPYGLAAGIWTVDGARQLRVANAMRCGQVFVNGYGAGGGIELPFGGIKKSGHGREKGLEALREFSVVKTIVINHG
jgi:aldehyde dehydrogenase (NAD+)